MSGESKGNLVLTRRLGESIIINVGGVPVVITVVQVKGLQIRLAIEADKEKVQVNRLDHSIYEIEGVSNHGRETFRLKPKSAQIKLNGKGEPN